MQLSRPSNIQRLAFSKFIGLTSLYLDPLIKRFLKTLFLMIRRPPVTICLWYLSIKGELFHLHGRLSGFVKNKSKSRLLKNLLKLKNLVDKGGASLKVTIGITNLTDDEGRD